MKPSALQYLACINCKSDLILREDETIPVDSSEEREIISGLLTCVNCLRHYPITRGVPRLIDSQMSSSVDINTGDRFGEAWKEFPRLDESYSQQFFDWIAPVDSSFLEGKIVLEAGAGKGRHAQIVANSGAKVTLAIDIGDAIDVAYQNVGHLPNLHLIQSDIRKLPFKKIFDFAFSVGVLHHMEDPKAGFTSVVDCLADHGSISIWVYGKENNWWITNIVSPVRESITAKLPSAVLKIVSTTLSIPVFLGAKTIVGPYAKLRKGSAKWLPELFYESYLAYISKFDFTEINHIVFDHLIAPVAYYIPRADVESWFRDAGFTSPLIRWHNKNSWSGFASRAKSDVKQVLSKLTKARV